MGIWVTLATDTLWTSAIAAVPIALAVAVVCRCLPCRPTTRHALWLIVLVWFLVPAVLPASQLVPGLSPRFVTLTGGASDGELDTSTDTGRPTGGVPRRALTASPEREKGGIAMHRPTRADDTERLRDARERTLAIRDAAAHRPSTDSGPRPSMSGIDGTATGTPRLSDPQPSRDTARRGRARTESRMWDRLVRAMRSAGPARDGSFRDRRPMPAPRLNDRRQQPSRPDRVTPPPAPRGSLPEFAAIRRPPGEPPGVVPDPEAFAAVRTATDSEPAHQRDDIADSSAAPVGAAPTRRSLFRDWIRSVLVLRDAVALLSPLPTTLWAGGIATCLLAAVMRIAFFVKRSRGAYRAPPAVTAMVARCARDFGLRRAPDVLMVRDPVSPMIWCGRRVRLILPAALWADLDDIGRRAVVCHELAHIRRRDHWVNWIQLVVFALYWWNPVVWWVRRRLSEEAELCCDAWVTWLYPKDRRAYAEALLKTKQFVNHPRRAVPVVGIGVTTGRAARFARRIRMVMTERAKPRLSASGILLAATLAVGGWLATPALSCPKAKAVADCAAACRKNCCNRCGRSCTTTCAKCGTPRCCGAACKTVCMKQGKAKGIAAAPRAETRGGVTTTETTAVDSYKTHLHAATPPMPTAYAVAPAAPVPSPGFLIVPTAAPRVDDPKRDDSGRRIARRLEELETHIARLSDQISRIRDRVGAIAPDPQPQLRVRFSPPPGVKAPRPQVDRMPPQPPRAPGPRPAGDEMVWRTYHLPEGKLKALTELMVRRDVPILVRPTPDGIEVQATPHQHAVFEGFVTLIHPPAATNATRAQSEFADKLSLVADAMTFEVRSDTDEPGHGAADLIRLAIEAFQAQKDDGPAR